MDETLKAISTVGFPIVAFLLMFWYANSTMKENTLLLVELKELIKFLVDNKPVLKG